MTDHAKGWTMFLVALGMMAGLLAPEVSALSSWTSVMQPAFAGKALGHFAAVVAAFAAGKIIPTRIV